MVTPIICLLLCSCDLSKNEAKSQILKEGENRYYYLNSSVGLVKSSFDAEMNPNLWHTNTSSCKEVQFFKQLEAEGYASIYDMTGLCHLALTLTAKTDEFIDISNAPFCSFKVGVLENIEITGIAQPSNKIRQVEYTATYKPNHIGDLYIRTGINNNLKSFKKNGSVYFTKYSDGWRMD
jgi:hypothetical protein